MHTPDGKNFFECLSKEKQIEIKQKYAAAILKNDAESLEIVILYNDFYGEDILKNNNPYMKFV